MQKPVWGLPTYYWTYVQWEAVQVARKWGFTVPVIVINYCYMGIRNAPRA